ncbi:MAG: hypothetical protein L6Q92_04455 [Phycisphaerae bacterium]|nr:hypothetical protein [Phycisphaerae bacterium]
MSESPAGQVLEIKKYPNRRFYDVTRSRHVTLADLHRLVREGRTIVVTDSKTGENITPLVLTQMILEHDPPKMQLFGADLLHQVIQANQQMLRLFIENYFGRAFESFLQSQSQFENFLRQAGFPGLGAVTGSNPLSWAQSWLKQNRGDASAASEPPPAPDEASALRATVESLQREVQALQERVRDAKPPRVSAKKKPRGRRGR